MTDTPAEPFGNTILCDDIRQEVDGKVTLVGSYQALMIVPVFPTTPPKLAFYVTFFEPKELAQARDFPVPIHIYFPQDTDQPVLKEEIAPFPDEMRDGLLRSSKPPGVDGTSLIRFSLSFVTAGHSIAQAGSFRTRANYNGRIIRLGATRVLSRSDVDKLAEEHPAIL